MKSSSLLLLVLPLLIFNFTINSSSMLVDAAHRFEVVHDVSGGKVRSGHNYYILPLDRATGGGLTLASIPKGSCPLKIVQDQHEVSNGLPLIFTPVNKKGLVHFTSVNKEGLVHTSTDLNIKFSAATICEQSTVWKLVLDESIGKKFVTTGGVEGKPGSSTLSNWFKIEKYQNGYTLRFCPTVCKTCRPVCGYVGIYIKNGMRRLALNDKPFKVMFEKV